MRSDGGWEPTRPTGRSYKYAVELLNEMDCQCEPSESVCVRCAAIHDLGWREQAVRRLLDACVVAGGPIAEQAKELQRYG